MEKDNNHESALNVNNGVPQPPIVNKDAISRFRKSRKKKLSVDAYVTEIRNGNRTVLSQAITLVESSLPEYYKTAQEIIEKCLPYAGNSIRIGITGVPGVGKSTFIESLGKMITGDHHKLAVLAIDPSSERSKGSILGDKTRMEELSMDENAFIRPSPSAGSLGGVARKTRESIILCEAAGFDTIFVETVGVGQSETAVHSMVDFFLLLMLAGAGDELQGIKRGIMEMADAIAITKADGSNKEKAEHAKSEYQNALHLFPLPPSRWLPKVVTCSAIEKTGLSDIWDIIKTYKSITVNNGYYNHKRQQQAKYWMYETINTRLRDDFYNNPSIESQVQQFENDVLNDKISSFQAAKKLLEAYFNNPNNTKNKES
jgi:LAO/AO transport system kinase